jgi:Fe-S-cluster-containing dehydrogenase component
MSRYGILIDYEFCSNCHTCEVSCKEELDIPEGRWGIRVYEIGPWKIDGERWQLTYVPVPTDLCNLCESRVAKGKLPLCVHNCYTGVMEFGPVEELSKKLADKARQVLFVPR